MSPDFETISDFFLTNRPAPVARLLMTAGKHDVTGAFEDILDIQTSNGNINADITPACGCPKFLQVCKYVS